LVPSSIHGSNKIISRSPPNWEYFFSESVEELWKKYVGDIDMLASLEQKVLHWSSSPLAMRELWFLISLNKHFHMQEYDIFEVGLMLFWALVLFVDVSWTKVMKPYGCQI
jgi:hypothetical protein